MVTAAAPAQPKVDPKKIEKIVDQIFPCTAEAAFVKAVHNRDPSKLRFWKTNVDDVSKKTEKFSEATAFIRRVFLARSVFYIECADELKKNLEKEGYDATWNIRINEDGEIIEDWDSFEVSKDSFEGINDESIGQYLDPDLLGPPMELNMAAPSLVAAENEEPMDFESSEMSLSDNTSGISMELEFVPCLPSPLAATPCPSTGFKNDHLGLEMDCDDSGLPIDFLE